MRKIARSESLDGSIYSMLNGAPCKSSMLYQRANT